MRPEEEEIRSSFGALSMVNSLPSYDNFVGAYQELGLPECGETLLKHKKERMMFMIVNLLRSRP